MLEGRLSLMGSEKCLVYNISNAELAGMEDGDGRVAGYHVKDCVADFVGNCQEERFDGEAASRGGFVAEGHGEGPHRLWPAKATRSRMGEPPMETGRMVDTDCNRESVGGADVVWRSERNRFRKGGFSQDGVSRRASLCGAAEWSGQGKVSGLLEDVPAGSGSCALDSVLTRWVLGTRGEPWTLISSRKQQLEITKLATVCGVLVR